MGNHLLRQENASESSQLIISDQSEYLCPADHRQLVSPYRKKDNISIVDVNYSAERIIKMLSPHEKDASESRVRVQEEKSRRMTEKVKKCAVRLMATTIKYAAHRLQLNFFRNVRVVRIIKERDESIKAQ